ncbi:hypothetical protein CEB3_c42770 [Peptococcaceae bacterium CEB3]|nr:hypothetical protein CEB3_c42770 [Peptococcaceae bacterium CEB3]
MDLWSPQAGMSLIMVLLTAYVLGVVHGITPDEHTWPITFSYAVGSYSVRTGMKVGLVFSLAFTIQRSLMSELAYLALDGIFRLPSIEYIVYLAVGVAMIFGGLYIFRSKTSFHLHWHSLAGRRRERPDPFQAPRLQGIPLRMAALHGFIAGFGFGSFALILYTVLAPAMPNPYLAWLPGFLFGVGTMTMQIILGAAFGWITRHLNLSQEAVARVTGITAGRTLLGGGLLFMLMGILGLTAPALVEWQVTTPIYVHNLHHLGAAFLLVVVVVMGIGLGSLFWETRRASAWERARSGAR